MFPVCCMQSGRSDGDGVEEMIKVIKKKGQYKKKAHAAAEVDTLFPSLTPSST